MKEKNLDYITTRGHRYRIVYHMAGPFVWEYDVLLWSPDPRGDWLGLTFGWERAIFPKRKMKSILHSYAEYKDAAQVAV